MKTRLEKINHIVTLLSSGRLAKDYGDLIKISYDESGRFALLNYNDRCQYLDAWDEVTSECRGLIVDMVKQGVAAVPFQKFFNFNEDAASLEFLEGEVECEVFEKIDGALGITYHNGVSLSMATRGSFHEKVAVNGSRYLAEYPIPESVYSRYTFLFEIVLPQSSVIRPVHDEGLHLLAIVDRKTCEEVPWLELKRMASEFGLRTVAKTQFSNFDEVVAKRDTLSPRCEGFVVKAGLHRLKVKGLSYLKYHKMAAGYTRQRIGGAGWDCLAVPPGGS